MDEIARDDVDEQISAIWKRDRPYLVNVAYGIARDIGTAEDAVQEAFVRLAAADIDSIDDVRGWLVVVTSRICLDVITSARARRERSQESDLLDVVAGGDSASDPADRVTLDDEVRGALNVVLDRLTPAERVVFVLHDVFATPFDSIAETVGRPTATCRQLARRARIKIQDGDRPSVPAVDLATRRAIADSFIQACAVGDVAGLISLLDPDVWGAADLGPDDPRSGVVNHGYAKVSRNLLRWFTPSITIVSDPLSHELLAFFDRAPYARISLDLAGGVVRSVYVQVEPSQVAWTPPRP